MSQRVLRLQHHSPDVVAGPHVAHQGHGLRAEAPDLVGGPLELVLVRAGIDRHVGALAGELERDGPSDVSSGSSDQRGLSLETHGYSTVRQGAC